MKAITLWPEWLFAFDFLGKRVENRPLPMDRYGVAPGEVIVLHAGCSRPTSGRILDVWSAGIEADAPVHYEPARDRLYFDNGTDDVFIDPASCPLGQAHAVARLGRCTYGNEARWAYPGSWHWHVTTYQRLPKPVQCKGKQGGWTVPQDVEAAIRAQLQDFDFDPRPVGPMSLGRLRARYPQGFPMWLMEQLALDVNSGLGDIPLADWRSLPDDFVVEVSPA